jgi:integrase/recombinase XerC
MPSDSGICPTDIWLAALAAQGRSPKTIESYSAAVGKLRQWRETTPAAGQGLDSLTRIEALAFARHLNDTYTPGGAAVRLRALRAGWSWMLEEDLVPTNVFARMRISVPEKAQQTASPEEIDAMLDHARRRSRRDHALLTVLVDTGCRRGELAHVAFADVDLQSGMITFRISKSRARTVSLSDRCVAALGRWLRQRGVGQGNLWRSADPHSLVNAVCLRHSGGTLRAHALRRAFAVRWLERGGSELGLQRVAGWSDLSMVRVYVRARADQLAADEMRRIIG